MFTIIMCLKCSENFTNPRAQVNLIDDDFKIAFELFLFATNIRKEVCDVLESFFLFLNMETKSLTTCYVYC
jgi:hypothetical protein